MVLRLSCQMMQGFFLGWVDFSLKMWCWVGYDDDGL